MTHVDDDHLVTLVHAAGLEAEAVLHHLHGCDDCRARWQAVARVLRGVGGTVPVPDAAVESILAAIPFAPASTVVSRPDRGRRAEKIDAWMGRAVAPVLAAASSLVLGIMMGSLASITVPLAAAGGIALLVAWRYPAQPQSRSG